jgi:hypothetical protein
MNRDQESDHTDLERLTGIGAMVAEKLVEEEPPLKKMDKIRLARMMLRIGLGAEWAPLGSFLRSHIAFLDRAIARADANANKGRRQRAATHRDDE